MKWGWLDEAVMGSAAQNWGPYDAIPGPRTCLHEAGRQYLVCPRLPLLSTVDSQWM